jgi:hypothetical protein
VPNNHSSQKRSTRAHRHSLLMLQAPESICNPNTPQHAAHIRPCCTQGCHTYRGRTASGQCSYRGRPVTLLGTGLQSLCRKHPGCRVRTRSQGRCNSHQKSPDDLGTARRMHAAVPVSYWAQSRIIDGMQSNSPKGTLGSCGSAALHARNAQPKGKMTRKHDLTSVAGLEADAWRH